MNRRVLRSCLCGLILASGLMSAALPSWAEEVKGLYRRAVVVEEQSDKSLSKAAREALASVLVRLTGQSSVLSNPEVARAIRKASSYLDAYRYEAATEVQPDGTVRPVTQLVMTFSRDALESLLRRNQLPLWPSNRPSVLVWIIKDDLALGRQLLPLQNGSPQKSVLMQVSDERGLPLAFPLLDLEDRVALTPNQLWDLDQEAITTASARYRPDAILVGRYSLAGNGTWLSAWTLLHKGHQRVFDLDSDSEDSLLAFGVSQASEYLAALYSVVSGSGVAQEVQLQISNVGQFADYVKLLAYLQRQAVVEQVAIKHYEKGELQVALSLKGELSQLLDALALDRRLVPNDSASDDALSSEAAPVLPESAPVMAPALRYSWAG